MKNTKVVVPVVLLLVGLGAGFFGGIQYKNYQMNKARGNFAAGGPNGASQRFIGNKDSQGTAGGIRGGAVNGTILSVDDKGVTVKLTDGSSKIVLFSDATTYLDTTTASKTDLKVGSTVAVLGSNNSDGSVTATSVQINPISFKPQVSSPPTP